MTYKAGEDDHFGGDFYIKRKISETLRIIGGLLK